MLTHVNDEGRPGMVGVGEKAVTLRVARARSVVRLPLSAAEHFRGGELYMKKGPVFQTAIVAGTMAAKRTWDLIPFCHPVALEACRISIDLSRDGRVTIDCEVSVHHRTGVEMEALTGASVAALTVYDMCKALSHEIAIEETMLLEKRGGASDYRRPDPQEEETRDER